MRNLLNQFSSQQKNWC